MCQSGTCILFAPKSLLRCGKKYNLFVLISVDVAAHCVPGQVRRSPTGSCCATPVKVKNILWRRHSANLVLSSPFMARNKGVICKCCVKHPSNSVARCDPTRVVMINSMKFHECLVKK